TFKIFHADMRTGWRHGFAPCRTRSTALQRLESESHSHLKSPRNALRENSGPQTVAVRPFGCDGTVCRSYGTIQHASQRCSDEASRWIEVCFVRNVIDINAGFENCCLPETIPEVCQVEHVT